MNRDTKYWIISASKDHVKSALMQGIAQTCHGKASPLKRMRKDDIVIFYSGKQTLGKPQACQQFTGIGRLMDDKIYQFEASEEFCPSRRKAEFFPSEDTSILPLIPGLNFIQDKKNWGYPFRFGLFEIDQHDFELISSQMLEKSHVQKD
jgi:hypothetical protein